MSVRVTTEDLEIGERDTVVISDDYVLVCEGRCYLAHTQAYANRTHVLTIKMDSDDPKQASPERSEGEPNPPTPDP